MGKVEFNYLQGLRPISAERIKRMQLMPGTDLGRFQSLWRDCCGQIANDKMTPLVADFSKRILKIFLEDKKTFIPRFKEFMFLEADKPKNSFEAAWLVIMYDFCLFYKHPNYRGMDVQELESIGLDGFVYSMVFPFEDFVTEFVARVADSIVDPVYPKEIFISGATEELVGTKENN